MEPSKASLREMFGEAAEIADPAARAAFLDSACRGDAILRAHVERLLRADSRAGTFLRDRPDSIDLFTEKLGDRIGRYRLRERIGRGGCGVVYLAEQEEPVRREVALKVIKLGMDTQSVVARFEAERQALALMEHPNIARVLDAGATETGRPFFVMELVRGVPVTDYCEQNGLSFRQRLELFIQICQAVQHAHQKGVIHRDLKPSNILVATQDGRPVPKVIDFGIAKATEQRLTEHTLTSLDQLIGTPAYMSPEQVGLGGRDVDTRSDIYSLGGILYELVTGQPPFAQKELTHAGLDEMRRIIREVDPPRPSTTISRKLDSNRLPSSRGLSREQLAAVRGDLDWIVMRCLEKDRARRYETANSLATDIRRHLDNEMISARPPSTLYRFQKIVRRNPRVAALTALLFLALAAGLFGALHMNLRLASANHQKDLANVRLAEKLRDFEWREVEDLVRAGKRTDALALLSDFLRQNPHDQSAATRAFSMLNEGNFGLPKVAPFQHGVAVNSVSVSADGQRVLTAADDGTARLWDLKSGRLLTRLAHPVKVISAVFAADERFVLTSYQDGSFRLWDSDESKVVHEFPKAPDARVPFALSRDRRRAALLDTQRSVRVWDLEGCRALCSSLELPGRITHAAFSRDSNILGVASGDGSVGVWTVGDARLVVPVFRMPQPVERLEFSPDGRILATTCGLSITLWDTQTWLKFREIKAGQSDIIMIAFTPDGRRLVSAAHNQPLKIWDVTSGLMIGQPILWEQPHWGFQISPDGRSVAIGSQSGGVRMFDARSGLDITKPFEHEGPVTGLAFTPDGLTLLTSSQDGTAQAWEIQHGRLSSAILQTDQPYSTACFSRDGRLVVGTAGATARMYDAATGQALSKPIIEGDLIYRIKTSPDGKKLATATWNGNARVWDLPAGNPRTPQLHHGGKLRALAFSPDSRLVATASDDTTARLWNAGTGEPNTPPLRHDGEVLDVMFSPDSRMLLTAGADGTARLWFTSDGRPVWPEPIRHKGIVWTAEFDMDGRRIVTASADKSAMVWDAESRRPLVQPLRHYRGISGARFSPDGRWILTWSVDWTARVWDSRSGEPVSQLMRHRDAVTDAAFSPDGTRVVTGSLDGLVRLWESVSGYPLSEPLEDRCRINVVEFSPDGSRFLSFAEKGALRTYSIITPPVPVPSWFCDLLQAVGGKRVNAGREIEPLDKKSLETLRQRFASVQNPDFYSRWARWFLWERMKDTAPLFLP